VRFSPISVYGSGKCDGHCYLMGYVPYNPDTHGLISEELAQVDPKCNYIPGIVQMEDGSELDDVNGGQIIKFSVDTASDPESLETELEQAILRTIEGTSSYIEGAARAINSLFDNQTRLYEGIRLDKEIYTEETIQSIKDSLDRKYSISLVFKKSRGRQPKDQIKYASISW
jgi:CO dehydrogenase/acetyl-CoA synthase beta subunit